MGSHGNLYEKKTKRGEQDKITERKVRGEFRCGSLSEEEKTWLYMKSWNTFLHKFAISTSDCFASSKKKITISFLLPVLILHLCKSIHQRQTTTQRSIF